MNSTLNHTLLLIYLVVVIFSFVIPFFYLRYIDRLSIKKCECSQGFNRNFVNFYSAFVYISIILVVFGAFFVPMKTISGILNSETKMVMSTGLSFLFAFCLYQYQKKVYETNCECATESWEPKVMKIHSYVIGLLVFISILNIISMLSRDEKITDKMDNSMRKSLRQLKNKMK
jgi:hypothetical protein